MLAFDISRLQKPVDGDNYSINKKNMIVADGPLRREEMPRGSKLFCCWRHCCC